MPQTIPTVSKSVTATWEPVDVRDAKKHLEIPDASTTHDGILATLLTTAREILEHDTGIVVPTSTCVLKYDAWPDSHFELPNRPVSSITSIQYVDSAGDTQTWSSSNYVFDANRTAPVIFLAYGQTWPTIRDTHNAITLTYVAGYSSQTVVPNTIKHAVLIKISQLFVDREGMENIKSNPRVSAWEFESMYQSLIGRLARSTYP